MFTSQLVQQEYMVEVTNHAQDRGRERMGVKRQSILRMARKALTEGLKHTDTKGWLSSYITSKANADQNKNVEARAYGDFLYLFQVDHKQKKFVLLTLYKLPKNIQEQARIQKRKPKKDAVDILFDRLAVAGSSV